VGLFSRFLSANFLHCALTGICCLGVFQLLFKSNTRWEESLLSILGCIVAHGVYDFFILAEMPRNEYSLQVFTILVLLATAWRYLALVEQHRLASFKMLAPLFTFLVGTALIFSLCLVVASHGLGLRTAILFLSRSALDSFLLILFFGQRLVHF
jgi:hypothetical protein